MFSYVPGLQAKHTDVQKHDKGKPAERQGHKATGLKLHNHDRRVAVKVTYHMI